MGKKEEIDKSGIHDFFNESKLMFLILGFSPIEKPLMYAYRVFIYLLLFSLQVLSAYAIYLNRHQKVAMINALHSFLVPTYGMVAFTTRIVLSRSIVKSWEMVKNGIYIYKDEELNEEQMKVKEKVVPEVRMKSLITRAMFFMGGTYNIVCFPLSQLLFHQEEEGEDSPGDDVNPYLPQVLYMPFDTRNFLGYSVAYFMCFSSFFYDYGVVICMNEVYVSCIVQMKMQLQILNLSLRNIQKRAYLMFKKRYPKEADVPMEDLFCSNKFQNCMYKCLRNNIQHHQALLRFRNMWQAFGGAILLCMLTVGCIVYASFIYLSFQKLPPTLWANYIITLMVELAYPYYTCLFGEQLLAESTVLFEELYGLPWMSCDKKFTKALTIIMARSLEPIKIHCLVLNSPSSLDTYGNLITAAYKAANIVRQSDKH